MAYVGYDPQARPAARVKTPKRVLPPVAWGRLVAVAASILAWTTIIIAARAVF